MNDSWDESRIQQYIDNEVQESLSLDYKSAGALGKNDRKKLEITKDVSAMANSAGGVIIYGISEFQEIERKHLPEKLDPINQAQFSKEWLEQIINSIQPRISGLEIYPIPLNSGENHVVYVVKIPQSSTAHQARDWRYYKRLNFSSKPMENHEIVDVMGRSTFPLVNLEFSFEVKKLTSLSISKTLIIKAKNVGQQYAQYVNCLIYLPEIFASHKMSMFNEGTKKINGVDYLILSENNTRRDVMWTGENTRTRGTSWFDPILPSRHHTWIWDLPKTFDNRQLDSDEKIYWKVYADNAPVKEGFIEVRDIKTVLREETPKNLVKFVAKEHKAIFYTSLLLFVLMAFLSWKLFF